MDDLLRLSALDNVDKHRKYLLWISTALRSRSAMVILIHSTMGWSQKEYLFTASTNSIPKSGRT
jgi:hypothetical protein